MPKASVITHLIAAFAALASIAGCDRSPVSPSPATASASSAPARLTTPTVNLIQPTVGLIGDTVQIIGTGFETGSTLTLDGVAARITGMSDTVIHAIVPAHAAGVVDVIVKNRAGQVSSLAGAFTYQTVTVTAGPSVVTAGIGTLNVSWAAPKGRTVLDWVGLLKVGEPSTSYSNRWWQYTNGIAAATVTIAAPTEPGEYELRYLVDDGFTDVARSGPITVRPSASASMRGAARER